MFRTLMLCLILAILACIQIEAAEKEEYIELYIPEITFEEALALANRELNEVFSDDEYFIHMIDGDEVDANKDIWQEYGIFSTNIGNYGRNKDISTIDEYWEKLNIHYMNPIQYEFIGNNRTPEEVPNPYFIPDSIPSSEIVGRWMWVENVELKRYVSNSSKEYKLALTPTQRTAFYNQIIQSLERKFGPKFDEDAARAESEGGTTGEELWLSRAGVIIPPTTVSRGMVRFWHIDNSGKTWYTTAIINPLYHFEPDFQIQYGGDDYTDGTVIKDPSNSTVTVNLKNRTEIDESDNALRVEYYLVDDAGVETLIPPKYSNIDHNLMPWANVQVNLSAGEHRIKLLVEVEHNPNIKEVEHTIRVIDNIADAPSGGLVIGSNSPGQEIFDVGLGIPSSEQLYVSVQAGEYIASYDRIRRTGSRDVIVSFTGTYEDNTIINEVRSIRRSYAYYDVDYYLVYAIKDVGVENYALPNGHQTLLPTSSYGVSASHVNGNRSAPSNVTIDLTGVPLDYNFDLRANSEAGYYSTNDGYIVIDGLRINLGDPIPQASLTGLGVIYKEGIIIPPTLPNQENTKTVAQVNYELLYEYNRPATESDTIVMPIQGNLVTVHTPVVCYPTIQDRLTQVQSNNPNINMTQLVIGDNFVINYPTTGQHLNIPGYGYRNYASTTDQRQVLFQFDVYEGEDERGTYHKANTWIDVNQDTTTYFIPNWVEESNAIRIGFRTLGINLPNISASYDWHYNQSVDSYKAIAEVVVELSPKVYNFKITDITDRNWSDFFKQEVNDFHVGLKDYLGSVDAQRLFTLPIMPFKNNVQGYEDYAVKLSYEFRFSFETNGDFHDGNDVVVVSPKFYHIDKDGQNRQEMDVYYESKNGFIRYGGSLDKMKNNMILLDSGRDITLGEIEDTAKMLDYQNRGNGYAYEDYLELLSGHYEKDIKYEDQILLTELQKTFIGTSHNRPSSVSENKVVTSVQKWYGEFYLPNQTVVVPVGTDLSVYDKLDVKKAPFLQEGYIVVNFEIDGYHDINTHSDLETATPYISYETDDFGNQWLIEGYDVNQQGYELETGDVVLYHIDKRASDDYE